MTRSELTTERVRLRPVAWSDIDALHTLWTHPDVRRFVWDDVTIPRADTVAIVERSLQLFTERRFGLWVATARDSESLVGYCGYWFFRDPPELELLYGLDRLHWGQGFATEMAHAIVRYGFEELDFGEIRASADAPNVASVRVLERLGMKFDRRAVADGLDTVFYRLSREESVASARVPAR